MGDAVWCGTHEGLTTHHRIPRSISRDDRAANLATLCRTCHDLIEVLDAIPLYLSWEANIIRKGTFQ
jgi:hypothetical protein